MDDLAILISLPIGFTLRIFLLAFDRQSQVRPIVVGAWEGIALYRGISTTPTDVDAYIACAFCALRLLFDCVFTENLNTMTTLVFSLLLAGLISDVVGSHHGHDIQTNHIQPIRRPEKRTPVHIPVYEIRDVPDYEVPESRRINRTRVIPRTNNETDVLAPEVPLAVQTDIRTQEHEIADLPFLVTIPNPMTPPRTPSKRISPCSIVEDMPSPDFANREDELQTPIPDALALEAVDLTVEALVDDADQDELQTPLDLNLRAFPALTVEQAQPPDETGSLLFEDRDDSASVWVADNVSEPSLQSGTELSIISVTNAQMITTKAEFLRNQAWAEQKQLPALEVKLAEAVSQNKIKDVFLLRREIESVKNRVQKMHERAARRHFRAHNPFNKDTEIDVHGLFIAEAVKKVETALEAAILNGRRELRVIVGRGRHSKNGPKLRPAVMGEMQRQGISCRIETVNPGVLVVTVPS
ncbi:hypothetical protein K438DRAFT_1809119 [Mycena galopus ATCC 62051]|nr:hypothetical protein K438DRAFT_1809119 [Mycena galopus ATCC 62051]